MFMTAAMCSMPCLFDMPSVGGKKTLNQMKYKYTK